MPPHVQWALYQSMHHSVTRKNSLPWARVNCLRQPKIAQGVGCCSLHLWHSGFSRVIACCSPITGEHFKPSVLRALYWTRMDNSRTLKHLRQVANKKRVSLEAQVVKNAWNAGDLGSIPGSGGSLEKGMATHSCILAWRIPWTEEPGRLQTTGSPVRKQEIKKYRKTDLQGSYDNSE